MRALLLSLTFTLTWDQPYPPLGTPLDALPDGVRCYKRVLPEVAWVLHSEVANDGACVAAASLGALPDGDVLQFIVRGFNEAGESPDSNVVEYCAGRTLRDFWECFGHALCLEVPPWSVCCGSTGDGDCSTTCLVYPDGCGPS